ncbi:hypothetical protein EIP91_011147 [Steccherinum ochraceum]|uniref:HNH nuclease domain-containing protein n=1 Tax=Steccherinum ochraceum TaxID=92696 RepID=A0A4R0RWD4_9APHY|nr:hypothetical protein EIP91_011147 [Steccherinum ochraceum]
MSSHVSLSILPLAAAQPIPLLRIPSHLCTVYAYKPLKWLLFCGFALSGSEGTLHQGLDHDLVDLDAQDVVPEGHYVYHLSGEMSLFDYRLRPLPRPELDEVAEWEVWREAPSNEALVEDVLAVRGRDCPSMRHNLCEAFHIIPEVKGDQYMEQLCRRRGGGHPIIGINDLRNMLVTGSSMYSYFDGLRLAFIKTPNFALQTNEIRACSSANAREDYCLTSHVFATALEGHIGGFNGRASSLERLPSRGGDVANGTESAATYRPPDFILNYVYASHLYESFGIKDDISDAVMEASRQMYTEGRQPEDEDNRMQAKMRWKRGQHSGRITSGSRIEY